MLYLAVCSLVGWMMAANDPVSLGVIVHMPDHMERDHWQAFDYLGAHPELLVLPEAEGVDAPFLFDAFEAEVVRFADHGQRVAATFAPHIRTVPWQPVQDADGNEWADRQNMFDPVFLDELRRFERAFCERFGDDPRIRRVYISPPSFFGEAEHYMGPEWHNLRFLCYDPLAQARFTEWLKERYGTIEGLNTAWDASVSDWAALPMPRPRMEAQLHTDADWQDLMAWRTEYLTDFMAEHMALVAESFHGDVGYKFSVGEYSAYQGTDAAAIAAQTRSLPGGRALHMTNPHSLSDLRYAQAILRQYGASDLVVENDGNRFGRTEMARIALNGLLAGATEFNFSHFGHLVGSIASGPRLADTAKAVHALDTLWGAYDLEGPPRHPVAFYHSHATHWVRAPRYRNRDVSRVYDRALSNGGHPDVYGYSWARWLALPDVTGEQLIRDGDLEGRSLVIVPNSSVTVFPESVAMAFLRWIVEGGWVVGFGADGLTWLRPDGGDMESPRVTRVDDAEWDLPSVTEGTWQGYTVPVWDGPLPEVWQARLRDDDGRVIAAEWILGDGRIVLFAGPVPAEDHGPFDRFYREGMPRLLRELSAEAGVTLPFHMVDDAGEPIAPLAMGYAGLDRLTGRHVFVAGAYDGSAKGGVVQFCDSLTGEAELALIDLDRIQATMSDDESINVLEYPLSQARLYEDPTNQEVDANAIIPYTMVTFDVSEAVALTLAP